MTGEERAAESAAWAALEAELLGMGYPGKAMLRDLVEQRMHRECDRLGGNVPGCLGWLRYGAAMTAAEVREYREFWFRAKRWESEFEEKLKS